MPKLPIVFVQIPCLNEERTLPLVLKGVPKKIPGVGSVEILIIDDGSSDRTIAVAKKLGVKHFVYHRRNQGLARSFHDGVSYALEHGADIVVNTDGDNQYPQEKIGELVAPILAGRADVVIGDRQTQRIKHFSRGKKFFQRFGSRIVSAAAGVTVPDAVSGFRAYSREALLQINTITRFSYTTETIIQAGHKRLSIASVPIKTNKKTRESRLFKSTFEHISKSATTIVRSTIMYRPYALFGTLGGVLLIAGLVPFIYYLVLYFLGHQNGHLHSLTLGAVLLISALLSLVLGVLADLIRINRILLEDLLERVKANQIKN
ncbi:MAG TPA: glycosyltransferase family 2 protein [Candidatus Saccharimonadales bacterium]|nr:glycosyltransferase family 2 protein [Candidatus Saccharimonadales bacterium]